MIKVDVISGFLGAGKTTFIKKMVEEAFQGEKIVLIENEFGEVGIDGGFLKDAGIEISEMNSGCICCTMVGDFDRNLKQVAEQFDPDRIIVEPSGVGKLSDVATSVQNVAKDKPMEINALVTVVNAVKAIKQMKAFGEFFNNQIEFANTVVLSRTQSVDDAKLEEVVNAIREKNADAAIITTPWDELEAEQIKRVYESKQGMLSELLEEAAVATAEHEAEHHHHDHEEGECCHHDHDHEEREHHHDHDHEEGECCHHDHDHEEHEHHHDHDHEEGECCHHDHEHEHHHDHDHEEGECCHHDHEGHHHHHADEVFTSWGIETPHKFDRAVLESALKAFVEDEQYDYILRSKGIVECTDGKWAYFDMVPGAYELRDGEPDYTGRVVVIGTHVDEDEMKHLFGME
jgi:G3E family GTPase